MMKHLCPCCRRHCYFDDPQCERGAEYFRTGVIPPRTHKPDGKHGGKKPSEQKMRYLSMDRDSKLVWNLREMGNTIRLLEDAGQNESSEQEKELHNELLACLREEDRADLLLLLEKVKHDWHHRYSELIRN